MKSVFDKIKKGFESFSHRVFQIWLWTALACSLTGLLFFLWHHGDEVPDYNNFEIFSQRIAVFYEFIKYPGMLRAEALAQLGMLLLLFLPVARMIFYLISFLFEGDATYVLISGLVIILIFLGVFM